MNLSPPSPPRNGFMPAWCGHFFRLEFGGVYKKKARLPRAFFHWSPPPAQRVRVGGLAWPEPDSLIRKLFRKGESVVLRRGKQGAAVNREKCLKTKFS